MLGAAAKAGGRSTFFTRLKRAEARLRGKTADEDAGADDGLFAAWDRLLDRLGANGPRFDEWANRLLDELRAREHDDVARGIARAGAEVFGLASDAPKATKGEEDAYWRLGGPPRTLSFEVKMAPKVKRVVNDDVEQAEGATRAAESANEHPARGVLITPHGTADDTAVERLDRVRLLTQEGFALQVERAIDVLRQYRRGWNEDAETRVECREAVAGTVPREGWLWRATESVEDWVTQEALDAAWLGG